MPCVAGRARDRPHSQGSAAETKGVAGIVFDNALMGSSDEDENLAILVVKDRRRQWFSLTFFHEKRLFMIMAPRSCQLILSCLGTVRSS